MTKNYLLTILTAFRKREDLLFTWLLVFATGVIAFRFYDSYKLVIIEVVGDLAVFALIYITYGLSKKSADDSTSSSPKLYLKAMVYCAILAGTLSSGMGTYYTDTDLLFGGGDRNIEFIPTEEDHAKYFWWMFLILLLPAANGIYKRRTTPKITAAISQNSTVEK